MPGTTLHATGFLLQKRPAAEHFEQLAVFSSAHGLLRCLKRVPKRPRPDSISLDLFDEVQLKLEPARQGETYFVGEARVLRRHTEIAARYEALVRASSLALLVSRNPVAEESRESTYRLLSRAFQAWASARRPEVIFLKSLYAFARDEGHPVKQEWLAGLPASDRQRAIELLGRPVAAEEGEDGAARRLSQSLERYLRLNTEILFE